MDDEVWWQVFREASELRLRLKEVEKTLEREQKRAALGFIRREAFVLLQQCGMPDSLRMLVVELWGGAQTVSDGWSSAKTNAAIIEASQTETIGKKRISRLLRQKMGTDTDYIKQIYEWRKDPHYKEFVTRLKASNP